MKRQMKSASENSVRISWTTIASIAVVLCVMVSASLAQSSAPRAGQNGPAANGAAAANGGGQGGQSGAITLALNYPGPNYELAAKFMPERINHLVFDVGVTPHWFETSDRFWYSYETPAGVRYWLVDPVKKSRGPLWDNAKVAAQLSTLTNYPYDAQHLPVRNLKLEKKDTVIQFEVEVSKDGVIPNEVKKATDDQEEEQNQENVETQNGRGGRGGRGAGGAGAAAAANTRTIYFDYELASGKITRLDGFDAPMRKPTWAAISPDEKWVIFARGENLYMMDADSYKKSQKKPDDSSIVEAQLTTDGEARYSYARTLLPEDEDTLKKDDKGDATNKLGMRRPAVLINWSKDSKKFALIRRDERKVGQLWVIHTLATPRPILETYSYSMPGEDNVAIPEIQIFDVASKQHIKVKPNKFADETLSIETAPITNKERDENVNLGGGAPGGGRGTARWLADGSDKLYFTIMKRDFKAWDVCVADSASGNVKTLFEDTSNVWMDTRPLRLISGTNEMLWWSERDGWGHYYLYDADGKLKNQVTSGEYMADTVVSVDDKARVLYFTANGHEDGEDPYYAHFYRVSLDGTGMKMLTPGNFSHAISGADSGKAFVDTYSRVDTAPSSVAIDDSGNKLLDLETTDTSRLMSAGYKMPETFKVKAADGVTDLYGVIYKPFDFDPAKRYPVILYVYPGPQTESVPKNFSAKAGADAANVALAQLGFVIVEVGARGGSPQRDKWYDSYGYGNLRDYGLADKKAATEELAATRPWMDINRVGIWGHSGGGFMTAAALLQYPDFFKAGWSESGNHDNNVYNTTWSEKYHGVKEETEKDGTEKFLYNIDKNSEIAKNLKGHLMLTSGDMDNNVHIANTMRLADALIKANKRFEMLVFPGMRHPYTPINDYVLFRRMDFFSHWLLGSDEESADIIELQREKQATPSTGKNLGEFGGGRGGRGGVQGGANDDH